MANTMMDSRERAFEAYFVHQEDLAFTTATLRNRLMALWAGERMGLNGGALEAYAKDVVLQSLSPRSALDPAERICRDLLAKGVGLDLTAIREKLGELGQTAGQSLKAA
jgi:hypothetical protein